MSSPSDWVGAPRVEVRLVADVALRPGEEGARPFVAGSLGEPRTHDRGGAVRAAGRWR